MNLKEKLTLLNITEEQLDIYIRVHAKLRDDSPVQNNVLTNELYEELKQVNDRFIKIREEDKIRLLSIEAFREVMPKCPECTSAMNLMRIDIPKGKNNVFGWKSALVCPKCYYEKFELTDFESRHSLYHKKIQQYMATKRRAK